MHTFSLKESSDVNTKLYNIPARSCKNIHERTIASSKLYSNKVVLSLGNQMEKLLNIKQSGQRNERKLEFFYNILSGQRNERKLEFFYNILALSWFKQKCKVLNITIRHGNDL